MFIGACATFFIYLLEFSFGFYVTEQAGEARWKKKLIFFWKQNENKQTRKLLYCMHSPLNEFQC